MLDRRCCRGSTDAEKALLEFNARNQVTMWGPNLQVKNTHGGTGPGNPQDYAGKTWSGLFGTYYKPRQQLFMDMLQDAAAVAAAAAACLLYTYGAVDGLPLVDLGGRRIRKNEIHLRGNNFRMRYSKVERTKFRGTYWCESTSSRSSRACQQSS